MASPDWEAIESAYRAGLMSLREIASQHSISEGAIRKQVRTESALSERVLIEATVEAIANVRMEHRDDIKKVRQITNAFFDELGAECADIAALEKLGELMFNPEDNGQDRLTEIYHKVISMPDRVKSVKALSDALKNLIVLRNCYLTCTTLPVTRTTTGFEYGVGHFLTYAIAVPPVPK